MLKSPPPKSIAKTPGKHVSLLAYNATKSGAGSLHLRQLVWLHRWLLAPGQSVGKQVFFANNQRLFAGSKMPQCYRMFRSP